jgi:hypothetical protein
MRVLPQGPATLRRAPFRLNANQIAAHVSINGSASQDTWTAYATVLDPIRFAAPGFTAFLRVIGMPNNPTAPEYCNALIELAVGAASSERPLVRLHFPTSVTTMDRAYYVPLHLPKGARLAARLSRGIAGATGGALQIGVLPSPVSPHAAGGFRGVEHVNVSAGPVAAPPTELTLASGAGGLHEMTAATTQRWRAFSFHIGTTLNPQVTARLLQGVRWALVAGPGSGTVVAGYFMSGQAGSRGCFQPMGPFPCDIPAGTRLQLHLTTSDGARTQCAPQLWGWY